MSDFESTEQVKLHQVLVSDKAKHTQSESLSSPFPASFLGGNRERPPPSAPAASRAAMAASFSWAFIA